MFKGIFLTTKDFNKVMKDTEAEIRANRIGSNKRTNLNQVVNIAATCATALKRCG
jgi:hypothetical protein